MIRAIFARRWLPWAILASMASLAGTTAAAYHQGEKQGRAAVQAMWSADTAAQQRRLATAETEYRTRERELQDMNREIADELHAQLQENEERHAAALAGTTADLGRLRAQFRGCSADLSRATSSADTAGGDDDAGSGGLSEQDINVALRIGNDANRVALKLQACQGYVRGLM